METETIKDLLSCYRPDLMSDGETADDQIQEALDAVGRDPELTTWLEEEQAFDRAFAAKVSEAQIPEGLRDGILARMSEATANSETAETFSNSASLSSKSGELIDGNASFAEGNRGGSPARNLLPIYGWLAAAAAVAVTLIAIFGFGNNTIEPKDHGYASVADFRKDMSEVASVGAFKDGFFQTSDLAEGRKWLASKQSPIYAKVPQGIVRYEGMGCNVLDWGGNKVSLVCFKPDDELVHLFVMKKEALKDATSPAEPFDKVLVHHNLQSGGWMDENNVYLYVGSDPDVKVGPLLAK